MWTNLNLLVHPLDTSLSVSPTGRRTLALKMKAISFRDTPPVIPILQRRVRDGVWMEFTCLMIVPISLCLHREQNLLQRLPNLASDAGGGLTISSELEISHLLTRSVPGKQLSRLGVLNHFLRGTNVQYLVLS